MYQESKEQQQKQQQQQQGYQQQQQGYQIDGYHDTNGHVRGRKSNIKSSLLFSSYSSHQFKALFLRFPILHYLGIVAAIWFFSHTFYMMYDRSMEYLQKYEERGIGYIGVRKGWFFGREIDLSDTQWRMFREYIPLLLIGGIVFVMFSKLMKMTLCRLFASNKPLHCYYFIFSMVFLVYLHGVAVIFPLLSAAISLLISFTFKGSVWNPWLTWIFHCFVKWSSDYYRGYRFEEWLGPNFAYLDQYRGALNWATYYNILMTRFISFNVDYYRACNHYSNVSGDEKVKDADRTSNFTVIDEHRVRSEKPRNLKEYNIFSYIGYVFYLPFYIGGPICSFNSFISYVNDGPQQQYTIKQLFLYIGRVLIYIVALEIMMHFMFVFALNEYGFWKPNNYFVITLGIAEYRPWEVCILGFYTLLFMMMKFLIIWRLFRFIGLLDGINPPENINRCVCNNMSVSEFWRSWHRSLHSWIVSYVYLPLGGRRYQVFNVWIVFIFIGLWHDLWWRWVAWALLNCVFFIIDILVRNTYKKLKLKWVEYYVIYQVAFQYVICTSLMMMIFANLAIIHGFEGTFTFMKQLLWKGSDTVIFLILYYTIFPIPVQWMVRIRELEEIEGRSRRF